MKKALFISVTLLSLSAFAGSKKRIIGVAAICDCYERTIDGEHYLGKVGNSSSAKDIDQAKVIATSQCKGKDDKRTEFVPYIDNCTFSKAIQERIGKVMKSHIERIKDEEEDNLQKDLLGTL